jgi:hypothetical protein
MDDPKAKAGAGDAQALAQRFLDLWQEQAGLLATDPKLAELSANWLTLWQQGAQKAQQAAQAAGQKTAGQKTADQGGGHGATTGTAPGSPADRAAAAAAASGDHQPDAAQLARRLADCERRLAALESALAGALQQPAARPRQRRSK